MFGKKKNQSKGASLKHDHSQIQIPMEPLSEKEIFEPLPEPVNFSNIKPTIRYQFRGMARRSLTYHRRQRFTTIGCLVIWPILLVILCYVLNMDKQERNRLLRYCTNEADVQFGKSFPLDGGKITEREFQNYNFANYPIQFEKNNNDQQACVHWFGESYPVNPPYQNATRASSPSLDSYYIPSPDWGWFNLPNRVKELRDNSRNSTFLVDGVLYFERYPFLLSKVQDVNQTVYYSTANADITRVLGTTANVTRKFRSDSWPPTNTSITLYNSSKVIDPSEGVLGAIPIRYSSTEEYLDRPNNTVTVTTGPYTPPATIQLYTAGPVYRAFESRDRVDEAVRASVIQDAERDDDHWGVKTFGGLHFDTLDVEKAKVALSMQFGVYELSSSNGPATPGMKQMIVMSQMTNALTRLKFKGQYVISQGIRALPYEFLWSRLNNRSAGSIAEYLFPFALSFLLPNIVTILVQEKEDRHRMMMAMNGLTNRAYYLAHYVEFMTMQLILTFFFAIACAATKVDFFFNTNIGLIILLFLLWAHVQTTFSFFLASFFSKSRLAALVVYFFVALSVIMAAITDMIFPGGLPLAWFIHPTFSFFYVIKMGMMQATMVNNLYPMRFADFAPGSRLLSCVLLLLGESILFILLTFYIDAVMPSEYGVLYPWHFPISCLFKSRSSLPVSSSDIESKIAHGESHTNLAAEFDQETMAGGDADVHAERERVRTQYDPEATPLIIDNLFHCYAGKVEPALKGMSFGVKNNTVLSLLGPNGAGKSTLIHLLTGLYEPTRGTASVAGANIRTEMSLVHSRMGVCPQHDILWGDLTVADHLLFYARLRGVPPTLEQQAVSYAIASVSLTRFRDRQVKGLSGGEMRRVSIAISLLGDNRVVFLDEPSTGLDPEVRRVIWDIVNRVKVNRTVVLTTHSMEEADILSDKIAIMTNGLLRCIGTSLHLKELYGSGFRLSITSKPGRLDEACQSIEEKLMRRSGRPYRRIDKFTNASVFEFDLTPTTDSQVVQQQDGIVGAKRGELSSIFHDLSQRDQFPALEDWGISQTTLEDVFIKIVTDSDASLTVPDIIQDTTGKE